MFNEIYVGVYAMVKICQDCGKEFTIKTSFQKYCSIICKERDALKQYHVNHPFKVLVCLNCGIVFTQTRTNQKYCSIECKRSYGSRRIKDVKSFSGNRQLALERDNYKCVICGETDGIGVHHKDFSGRCENPNNELDNLMTICKPCHTKIHKPTRFKESHMKTLKCQQCGKEIREMVSRIADNRGKYCSVRCSDEAKITKVAMFCECCGKEFNVVASRAKRGKVKYCSMDCRKAAGYATRKK
jgi:5-methylcytosine-specific restriction endonuclease McrA